jgi:hypothetical protein
MMAAACVALDCQSDIATSEDKPRFGTVSTGKEVDRGHAVRHL